VTDPSEILEPDLSGETLDRYHLLRRIGVGGMGAVYEAEHTVLRKRSAVKVLRNELTRDEIARKRFLREARAASAVVHPNVVAISDCGETPQGRVFLVMELLAGRDLQDLLDVEVRLDWPRTRAILLQVVSALEAAHLQDIVHRDIKPSNCFLADIAGKRDEDVIKVLDFGIAKLSGKLSDSTARLTSTDEIFGTVAYMAPEMALGVSDDPRSDVYAVGVMMYRMLVGELPFSGGTAYQIISQHVGVPPSPPRAKQPTIPEGAEAIVLRALAKDPKHRFSSMQAFAQALRRGSLDATEVLLGMPTEVLSVRLPTPAQPAAPVEPTFDTDPKVLLAAKAPAAALAPADSNTSADASALTDPKVQPDDSKTSTYPTISADAPAPLTKPKVSPTDLTELLRPAQAPIYSSESPASPRTSGPPAAAPVEPSTPAARTTAPPSLATVPLEAFIPPTHETQLSPTSQASAEPSVSPTNATVQLRTAQASIEPSEGQGVSSPVDAPVPDAVATALHDAFATAPNRSPEPVAAEPDTKRPPTDSEIPPLKRSFRGTALPILGVLAIGITFAVLRAPGEQDTVAQTPQTEVIPHPAPPEPRTEPLPLGPPPPNPQPEAKTEDPLPQEIPSPDAVGPRDDPSDEPADPPTPLPGDPALSAESTKATSGPKPVKPQPKPKPKSDKDVAAALEQKIITQCTQNGDTRVRIEGMISSTGQVVSPVITPDDGAGACAKKLVKATKFAPGPDMRTIPKFSVDL
jgi:serine/threonine protein kinase